MTAGDPGAPGPGLVPPAGPRSQTTGTGSWRWSDRTSWRAAEPVAAPDRAGG